MPGSSSSDRTQSSLDKGKDFRFGFSKNYPYSSQKYSFGQRKASATSTTPAKPDTMEINSPSTVAQVSRTSTGQPFTSMLMGPKDETGVRIDRNAIENRFRLYKGRFGLKGFGSQPLEGANALPLSTDTSIVPKQSFKGFELRNSEISRPKRIRIHKWHNQRDETEPGNSGDFKTPPSTARGDGSVPRFKSNHTTIQVQTLQGFQPSKNRTVRIGSKTSWNYSEQNPVWLTKIASSSYLGSEGRLKDKMSPSPMPRAAKGNRPATEEGAWFKTPTSSTVRGKRVKLVQTGRRKLIGPIVGNSTSNSVICRLPRVKAVTYEDILASASFSSVRAPGHQGHFPNMTIGEEEGWSSTTDGVKNMSRSPEANVINEKKDRESVGRKEETNNEVEMSDLFFETEGSGRFDLSNVLLTATEDVPAGNDLLDLDYLRKSTGNISFKSLSKSHLEQR
ncbi:E3 ubiquitin-protein ligase-like isoform X1 [Girardinichthys multiradiatus]|uniref:E3 ubiquitin-protein ligase-like isoform X1 n=1 Tax=Girardinichthys multiradiatus TaxID=208333 RepID=UPI001FABA594|nr:E3 ubiquitin-protein ligase-like isoform X1 [Girardinichthys multiradiatus]